MIESRRFMAELLNQFYCWLVQNDLPDKGVSVDFTPGAWHGVSTPTLKYGTLKAPDLVLADG